MRYPIDLLIFDLDGTLVDSRVDIARAVNLTFREVGVPERANEEIYGYVGNGVRRLIHDALGPAASDKAVWERAIAIFETHYLKHLLDETRFYPGVEDVLRYYRNKRRAVVTNKPLIFTLKIIEGLGAADEFDLVLGSEPLSNLKPHPEMIERALADMKVPSERAVMIGDSVNDILAARAAGAKSCAVGYGLADPETLKGALPDFFSPRVEDLKDLFE